jgi:DNA-binding winged helix-turn-helix (wHTH) protein
MDEIVDKVLRFDRFTLDLKRGCVLAGGQDISLRPKAFKVISHLAKNAGQLVAKQELCEAVWPNVTVSDDSLVQCIREIRQKLGDDDHTLIKTVARRGYLLNASVLEVPALKASVLAEQRSRSPNEPDEVTAVLSEQPQKSPIPPRANDDTRQTTAPMAGHCDRPVMPCRLGPLFAWTDSLAHRWCGRDGAVASQFQGLRELPGHGRASSRGVLDGLA